MGRTRSIAPPEQPRRLEPASAFGKTRFFLDCQECGKRMPIAYQNKRHLLTLHGRIALIVPVRRCPHAPCKAYKKPVRPWEEGTLALPLSETGLDLVAFVGHSRYHHHKSLKQIHQDLVQRELPLCERSVCNLLHRYEKPGFSDEELVALRISASLPRLKAQGRVVLALDGLQPDKGHEVLGVVRDCLSDTILLAKSLLSAAQEDLADLLREVKDALPVPIAGVISDGQNSLRPAVASVVPGVPHQLCQFHYLREAATRRTSFFRGPVYEADRQAKKELKKRVRGIRPLEHTLSGQEDESSQVVRGYCLAVRSALTEDGQPPLEAPGLRLHERLNAISTSLSNVEKKGDCLRRNSVSLVAPSCD